MIRPAHFACLLDQNNLSVMKTCIISIFLFLLAAGCKKDTLSKTFEDAQGTIEVFVCTRGCYQYLLRYDDHLLFPDTVPEALKKDGQQVLFSGQLLPTSTMVKKPAPNDIPIDDFKARNIKITSMEVR